jgi:hypothetical protein
MTITARQTQSSDKIWTTIEQNLTLTTKYKHNITTKHNDKMYLTNDKNNIWNFVGLRGRVESGNGPRFQLLEGDEEFNITWSPLHLFQTTWQTRRVI